jgi:hypothetical protein
MSKQKDSVNLKITKSQIVVFLGLTGMVAAGVLAYVYYQDKLAPVTVVGFNGETLGFRVDLRQADKVEVRPDEATLINQMVRAGRQIDAQGNVIFRKPLRNITIVFKSTISNDTSKPNTMGWYTVQVTEIIKKMTALYHGKLGTPVSFQVKEVSSYEGLKGSNTAPIVALVHPDLADGTYVSVDPDNDVVIISGGDSLKDFDLATEKFLMVVMGIKV